MTYVPTLIRQFRITQLKLYLHVTHVSQNISNRQKINFSFLTLILSNLGLQVTLKFSADFNGIQAHRSKVYFLFILP